MATGTKNIAKIWDFYTSINNSGDLDEAKSSLSKKYGTFSNVAAPSTGWGTGLCPNKTEWLNMNNSMNNADFVINNSYGASQLVKYSDISYILRAASLNVSPTSWKAPVAGGNTSITVSYTNSDNYGVTSSQSWVTVPTGNQTASSVAITASSNTSTGARSAVVTFYCTGRDNVKVTKTVTVNQNGKSQLTVNPTSLSFTPAGGLKTSTGSPINMSSYTVSIPVAWATASKSGNTISVSATVNSGGARNTTVYVHGKGSTDNVSRTATISISQSSGQSNISISSGANHTAATASGNATVTRTNMSSYSVASDSSWCSVSKNNDTVNYTVTMNTGEARTATIYVHGKGDYDGQARTASIKIGQAKGAPGISLNPSTTWAMSTNAAATKQITVTLTNATTFSVAPNDSWVTHSISGNTVTLSATKNTGNDRSTTVRFGASGTYGGAFVYKDILVTQEGVSNLTVSPTSWTAPLNGGSTTVTGTPTNLTTYYATSSAAWVTASKSGNTITITSAKANGTARNANVYLYGKGDSDSASRTATVAISQAAGTSNLTLSSNKTHTPAATNGTLTVTPTYMGTLTAVSNQTWCTVSISNNTVSYSVTKNTDDARTATVSVHGKGTYDNVSRTASVYISQSNGSSSLTLTSSSQKANLDASSHKFGANTTNISGLTATSNNTALATVSMSGNTFTVSTTKANGSARTATITVAGYGTYNGATYTKTHIVNQDSGAPSLSLSSNKTLDPSAQSGTLTATPTYMNALGVTRGNASWCTVSISNNTVSYSVTKNTDGARTATVTVYGTGTYGGASKTATVYISQSDGSSSLSINGSTNTWKSPLDASSSSFNISQKNMNALTVKSSSTALVNATISGNTVTLTSTKATGSARTATVYVHGTGKYTGSGITVTFTVHQDSGAPSLSLSGSVSSWKVPLDGGNTAFYIKPTYLTGIKVSSSVAAFVTATISGDKVSLTGTKATGASRTATINVTGYGTYGGATKTVSFTAYQDSGASSMTNNTNSLSYTKDGGSKTVTPSVTYISSLTATAKDSWCTTSVSGNTVTITASKTNSDATRTTTVTITGVGKYDGKTHTATVTVTQDGAPGSITVSPVSATLSSNAAAYVTYTVTLTNASGFKVTDLASWLTVHATSTNAFTLKASTNTGDDRSDAFYVSTAGSYDGKSRTATVSISQEGKSQLSVNPLTHIFTPAAGTTQSSVSTTNMSSWACAATSSGNWLSASKNGNNVNISVVKNTSSSRTGKVFVSGKGDSDNVAATASITITQNSGISSLSISGTSSWAAALDGGNKSFNIIHENLSGITATSSNTGFVTVSRSGDTINMTATKATGTSRYASVTVKGYGTYDGVTRTVTFTASQESGAPSLSLSGSTSSWKVPLGGGNTTFDIKPTYLTGIKVTSSTAAFVTATISGNKVSLTGTKAIGSSRTATINVTGYGTYGGLTKTISFTAYQDSGASSLSFISGVPSCATVTPAAQTGGFGVSSNNITTVGVTRGSSTWCTVSINGATVTYGVTKNTSAGRTATITVFGTGTYDNTKKTATVYIYQATGSSALSATGDSTWSAPLDPSNHKFYISKYNMSGLSVTSSNTAFVTASISGDVISVTSTKATGSSRYASVTVRGYGTYNGATRTVTFTVNQESGAPSLSISGTVTSWTTPLDASTNSFTIVPTYLTGITATSGNTSFVTVSRSGNTINMTSATSTGSERTTNITVRGYGIYGGATKTVFYSVNQPSGKSSVTLSSSQEHGADAASGYLYAAKTNIKTLGITSGSASWCTVGVAATGTDGVTFTYSITKSSGTSRTATITVYGTGSYDKTKRTSYVYISQGEGASSISVNPTTKSTSPAAATYTATVTRNNISTYYATSSASWLGTSVSNNSVIYSVSKNTSSERTGYIYVHGVGDYSGAGYTATITVTQQKGSSDLTISPTSISANIDGGSSQLTVTSSNMGTLYATSTVAWATATISGSAVTVNYAKSTGDARTGYIKVYGTQTYAGGTKYVTATISQADCRSSFVISENNSLSYSTILPKEASTATVSFNASNITYQDVVGGTEWLTPTRSGNTVIASAKANTGNARTATVYVTAKGTYDNRSYTATFVVGQKTGITTINVSPSSMSFNYYGGTEQLTVTNPAEYTINCTTPSWITETTRGGSASYVLLNFTADSNPSSSSRNGNIIVHTVVNSGMNIGAQTATIAVTQYGKPSTTITANPASATFTKNGGSSNHVITFLNASSFLASVRAADEDWLSVSQAGTTSGSRITISATRNTSVYQRNGIVIISAGGTSINIPVTQAAGDPLRLTMIIDNIEQICELVYGDTYGEESYWGVFEYGTSNSLYSLYGLVDSICVYDGYVENTITGTVDQWLALLNDPVRLDLSTERYGALETMEWTELEWNVVRGAIETVQSNTSQNTFPFRWPLPEVATPPSLSKTSVTLDWTGGTQRIYIHNGTLTKTGSPLPWASWQNATAGNTYFDIKVDANPNTSARRGTMTVYVGDATFIIAITQSGKPVSTPVNIYYILDGWDVDSDLYCSMQLSARAYNYSTGESVTICTDEWIDMGGPRTGESDGIYGLRTIDIPAEDLNGWYIQFWGEVNDSASGQIDIDWIDGNDNRTNVFYGRDLDTFDASPVECSMAGFIDYSGVAIVFHADTYNPGGGTSDRGELTVSTSNWTQTTSPISGYFAWKSGVNKGVGNSLDTMRVYTIGKAGNLTIYINNDSESRYDYTVAGKLDTALPTTASSVSKTSTYAQGSSYGITAGLATSLSGWTAVSYSVPDKKQHFIEIAYRKDSSVNGGADTGYCLLPNSW